MTFRVSKLQSIKSKPELVSVSTVVADRVQVWIGGFAFFNDDLGWSGGIKNSTLVAYFPDTNSWVVESV